MIFSLLQNFDLSIYMLYIIASICEFYNHNANPYRIGELPTLVNGQDERASPTVDKCVF